MEADIINYILNALLAGMLYFVQSNHNRTKEDIRDLEIKVDKLQRNSLDKEDFKEFKSELYKRLDKLDETVKLCFENRK